VDSGWWFVVLMTIVYMMAIPVGLFGIVMIVLCLVLGAVVCVQRSVETPLRWIRTLLRWIKQRVVGYTPPDDQPHQVENNGVLPTFSILPHDDSRDDHLNGKEEMSEEEMQSM
jgi:hypothetical protein